MAESDWDIIKIWNMSRKGEIMVFCMENGGNEDMILDGRGEECWH